jgi:ATP-dependent helicase YprA (DUF1998 family)
MNVFELRERLIGDYSSYIRSFIRIRDERVGALVTSRLDQGRLWPDPLIQLNPSFQYAGTIDDLVAEGLLHSECTRIFRAGKDKGEGKPLRLYQHQSDAIRRARAGRNYVLTTGTGSGKSLAYIVPIVDHVLRHGSGRGIQAIVVYPMNALANSQFGELQKFLQHGYPDCIPGAGVPKQVRAELQVIRFVEPGGQSGGTAIGMASDPRRCWYGAFA